MFWTWKQQTAELVYTWDDRRSFIHYYLNHSVFKQFQSSPSIIAASMVQCCTQTSTFPPGNCYTQGLPLVVPQEKTHKQGTSSLPVFKDDSYGMRGCFLFRRLISPFQTSGCCSVVKANSATVELNNMVLLQPFQPYVWPLNRKTPSSSTG